MALLIWKISDRDRATSTKGTISPMKTPLKGIILKNQTDVLKEIDRTIPNSEKYSPFLIGPDNLEDRQHTPQ